MSAIVSQSISDHDAKTHAVAAYILLVIGLFTAIPMLLGAIWAMIKKGGAEGTVYHSHYRNAIRTFWWTLCWSVLGFILTFIVVGYAVLGIAWLWALYRIVNGLAKITSDLPYPL